MEENILKNKYNELLSRYKKGMEFLEKNPEDEKAKSTFESLQTEMNNVIQAIGDVTAEEIENGFEIQEITISQKETTIAPTIQPQTIQPANTFDFNKNWEMAQSLAKSSIIPKEFQGKPENIVLCMGLSKKMGLDFVTVVNNLQMVMGHQEWKGSFIPVLIERTGKYTDLEFNFVGKETDESFGCYLEATRTRDGKRIQGTTITIGMAKQEGWYSRNSKWKTMPKQLLIYRASTFFARAYCASALNGIYTEGEASDISNIKSTPIDIL